MKRAARRVLRAPPRLGARIDRARQCLPATVLGRCWIPAGRDRQFRPRRIPLAADASTPGSPSRGSPLLFVGLIVPHLVRMLVGPGHRVLIPLSAIVGAV
ncbi:iron chelate uptake ABC transporter family permease subunit, partial [Nocardia sp. NPDC059246]|uniref:iron chelate uptake ABC transporter family permease subunit n=1 Tax=unclassified Nocardia TaxID=2637762 RepID=UPI003691169F